jgi:hypothetical protein
LIWLLKTDFFARYRLEVFSAFSDICGVVFAAEQPMYTGHYIFTQLMDHVPWPIFRQCVARYDGEHKIKHFSCRDQFHCYAFAFDPEEPHRPFLFEIVHEPQSVGRPDAQ